MKRTGKRDLPPLAWLGMAIVIVICFAISASLPSSSKQSTVKKPTISAGNVHSQTPAPTNSVYSSEELHSFWDTELKELVEDQLLKSALPYPEINERFKKLNAEIFKKTGKGFLLSKNTSYHWADIRISAATGMSTNNEVYVEAYVPSLLRTYLILKGYNRDGWRDAYATHIIITLMHEMEHTTSTYEQSKIDIKEESRAWADTCRYIIFPLVATHKKKLISSEETVYTAWLATGGDTSRTEWLKAMQEIYGDINGKTNK